MREIKVLTGFGQWDADRINDIEGKVNNYIKNGWIVETFPTYNESTWYAVMSREKD